MRSRNSVYKVVRRDARLLKVSSALTDPQTMILIPIGGFLTPRHRVPYLHLKKNVHDADNASS
jgi:hypothetical protein